MDAKFALDVSFSEATGEAIAAYLRVREGTVAETREASEGVAFADYGSDGRLLGIELLAPCTLAVMDRVGRNEPEPVQRFLRGGPPRELIVA